jgi:Putative peptidoglycan binding domain
MSNTFEFETIPFTGESFQDSVQEAEYGRRFTRGSWVSAPRLGKRLTPRSQSWRSRPVYAASYPVYVPQDSVGASEPVDYAPPLDPAADEKIRWVQQRLNAALGLRLPLTGDLDAATRSALRILQRQRGLPPNGRLTQPVQRTLARSSASNPDSAAPPLTDEPPFAEPTEPVEPYEPADASEPTAQDEFGFEIVAGQGRRGCGCGCKGH